MSDYPGGLARCDAVRDDLPELALGVLSGRRRSEVLDHVGTCTGCNAELQQLSTVADALLQLTPQVDPPLGFELRVAARLQDAETHRRKHRWRTRSLCAAAAVLVIVGFALGAFVAPWNHNNARPAAAPVLTTDLTSGGRVLGQVSLSDSSPAWMFVTINGAASSGPVRCDVTLASGRVETVGVFSISGEYGGWGAPLAWPAHDVRSAQLVDSSGSVVADAEFGT